MRGNPTGVLRPLTTIAGSVLLAIAVSGCGSPSGDQSPMSAVERPAPTGPGGHGGLTARQYAAAVALARGEVRKEHAALTSATATVGRGRVTRSNTGYPCTSGTVLELKLIGTFPHTSAMGLDTRGHTVTAEDYMVHAVVLTADAESGRACEVGVQTGQVAPEPGATVLTLD